MKLEHYITRMYRFSSMREFGKSAFVAVVLVVSAGIYAALFLPDNTSDELNTKGDFHYLSVDPTHVKEDDEFFHFFLETIKQNDGTLILGTSESGFLDGYNYWELLNADPASSKQFSVLYGAGRSCERYIPSIINHPDTWKNLKILVFVNPVYWREDLSQFNSEYQERYMHYPSLRQAYAKTDRKKDFELLFDGGKSIQYPEATEVVETYLDKHIYPLYHNRLRSAFGFPLQRTAHFTEFTDLDLTSRTNSEALEQIKNKINPDYNCSPEFIGHGDLLMDPLFPEAVYRNTAFDFFIDLCKKNDIQVTFIIGPYNKQLALQNGQTDVVAQYEKVLKNIRTKLTQEKMPFIDASDVSYNNYAFSDKQHNGQYGGYLIYQRIKSYLYEDLEH